MQTQWDQNQAVNQFSPFNVTPQTSSAVNGSDCAAASLALFALRDQSVRISSSLIDDVKADVARSRTVHFTRQIKDAGIIVNAFLMEGIGDVDKAKDLIKAIDVGDCHCIESSWDTFITGAMDNLMSTLHAHTTEALKGVKGIDNLLSSVSKDYSLFDLSIEQNADEQACDLVFQNTNFLCHIPTGLFEIENKAIQYFYKELLEKCLRFGGIWQEDLIQCGLIEHWVSDNLKEKQAAEKLLVQIIKATAENIDAVLNKNREIEANTDLFYVIDELIEMEFCGEVDDKEHFKEWLEREVEHQIKSNKLISVLSDISKVKVDFKDCPSGVVTEQLKALLKASKQHLGDAIPESFILDEDNTSHFTFVLKNHDKNEALDSVSQEQYEYFCNTGEDNEIYRIDMTNENWLSELKEMILALNIMFVGINAMLDWLRDNESM